MRRIFVDPEFVTDDRVILDGESLQHAVSVLRLKKGDRFQVLCGRPALLTAELDEVARKSATARIIETTKLQPLPIPSVNLAVSLPRFSSFEWVIEKSVELGVSEVQPLISDFSFVKKKSELTEAKTERWQKIIKSATEQSIRPDLMRILPVLTLSEWANRTSTEPCLFGYENAVTPARHVLEEARALQPNKIWALAGSEGGFSEQEVQSLLALGHQPATLGSQILRAETACVALISIIKYEFDHMRR